MESAPVIRKKPSDPSERATLQADSFRKWRVHTRAAPF
jgi:hypothetical protein